ncbi:MAG: hypothetical protein IJ105_03800 [Bacilli bacterium]|nr:hypothetical protein [Bacilli bacterium]MBQ9024328.1 hypothetical protein [Bacilli bacterium]
MNNNENNIFEENVTNENITSETNDNLSNQMPINGVNQNNDINSINNQSINNEIPQKYKLTLTRKKSFVGGMVGFDIYIDNVKVGKIKNGKTVELEITGGEHIISIHKNNPVSINITKDTTADVVVFGANNFGITNINGQGTESNNSINNNYIEKNNKKTNMTLIISIILPIVSLILFILLKSYITPWVYGLVIGFAIVNMVGLKNFKDNEKYKSLLIKNLIAIIISLIMAVISIYISVNEISSFDEISSNRSSSSKINSKLKYTIPNGYKLKSKNELDYKIAEYYEYTKGNEDSDDYINCLIDINIIPTNNSEYDYKEDSSYSPFTYDFYTKSYENINGNKWLVSTDGYSEYNYGIEKDGIYYIVGVSAVDLSGYCEKSLSNFVDSLKF